MSENDQTRTLSAVTGDAAAASGPGADPAIFVPGAIIAGRYRLVAPLGRGGMGEVYRAEDLTLDQPVALKFLPAGVAADEARLAQFHNELRIARQVSHKNVCRLYDIGEVDGRRFLTMEYVDGEDLASLLRRVGRIPQDRAVEMARQLCAGVAAAHERGVIHRDLKPANIMIDGEGHVRVADFGVATAAGRQEGSVMGTPQYMSPEQLAGGPASPKSDIYALGLILFELFTGRRAIESKTPADLKEFHQTGTVTTPSSIVRDLEPAVERVILRCLDRDPARRPASALALAAALPGGDPLAAALADGETLSPEILAAAGETEALGAGRAVALLTFAVAGTLAFAVASSRTSLVGRTPLDDPPAVLVDRAEQVIARLGYANDSNGHDHAFGWTRFEDYIDWLKAQRLGARRWDALTDGNPSAVRFWYRTAPRELLPLEEAAVTLLDPPSLETGMRTIILDPQGRLQRFRSVPPQFDDAPGAAETPDWRVLFEAAGLSIDTYTPSAAQWVPEHYADSRAAWEGPHPVRSDIRMRVEAAAYRGRPVFFEVIGPWTQPERMHPEQMSTFDRVFVATIIGGLLALIVVASVLARRHVRANRADVRGALRLTAYVSVAGAVSWALRADHSRSLAEVDLALRALGELALFAIIVWTLYVALEPYVRRLWPDALLGWSRLLTGHVRDPRVGRDMLVGMAAGVTLSLIDLGKATLIPAMGFSAPFPKYGFDEEILGLGSGAVWVVLLQSVAAISGALFTVLLIVILRLTLRLRWLAIAVTILILSLTSMYDMNVVLYSIPFPLASGILLTIIALRFGLLSLVVALCLCGVLAAVPLTLETSRWFAAPSNWTLLGITGLACFGFYAARGGQPLFGAILKD